MIPRTSLLVTVIMVGLWLSVSAQSPCNIPFPDSCRSPQAFCAVPWENCPWQINGLDIVYLVSYLRGGPAPHPYSKYDVNCDGVLNWQDVSYLRNYAEHRGPTPLCCFYQCQPLDSLGAIGDRVWQDANGNGIQDPGEIGLGGVPVDLINCDDTPRVLAMDTTNANGVYLFSRLEAGSYRVRFWRTDEYYYSPMDQGNNDQLDSDVDYLTGTTPCFELSPGEVDTSWDAGVVFPSYHGDVGDFVWNDENRNGIQDSGERGLPNITVIINTCEGMAIDSTETDSTGYYVFHDRGIARAYLHFVLPDGFRFSPIDRGSNDSLDSDANPETGNTACFDIPEGNPILIWDAGMYREEQPQEGCTWQLAWWKNHAGFRSQPDSVSRYLPLWLGFPDSAKSIHVTTNQIAIEILRIQGRYGHPFNSITRLYAQLLAAKLNIANGASDRDIAEKIELADAFLATHDWHDWVRLDRHERELILGWVIRLAAFNNGWIGPGRCHWEDDEL